ncbi:MAG: tetratricopeptide repeat protein [Planctomycetaceae bacterium]|nr:tetratricopeptide repeat protein [Planctomycetaceae bacterium]
MSLSRAAAWAFAFCVCLSTLVTSGRAADLAKAQRLFETGQYEAALEEATAALEGNISYDHWYVLKAEIELTLGRWQDARATIETGLEKHKHSIRLRWLGREAFRHTNDTESARRMQEEIIQLAERTPWRYSDAENLVTLGKAALLLGIDPKDVLEAFFERAQKASARSKSPPLAMGELALSKHDYKLAAEAYRQALERFPDDADLHYGLAAAIRDSNAEESAEHLKLALESNPRHVPSLLSIADRQIDAESYDDARETLESVLEVNPTHPEAHAYLSVIAHLQNDPDAEQSHREQALSSWGTNPKVDFIIGRELSQKYRFQEGLAAQRRAIKFDESYIPARRQAAQDLLRLGEVEEGWALAGEVHQADEYDVAAYNLVTLRDEMSQFSTLEDETFILRMDAHEARVYGQRVLELLHRAKDHLCDKYGLELTEPVTVEIFPDPADFEVRTFGMPGIPGFLGVCFGKVITANSPASQGANPNSWEAVLWHEFCHVVTLQATNNRMPRWLSEGISVYEEKLADTRWGQAMTPRWREKILNGELTPVSELSSAFLNAESGEDVQFAYFESAMVVEYLVDTHGLEALKSVLNDLAMGLPINEALPRHTDAMQAIEVGFAEFAERRADEFGEGVDWSMPDLAVILNDEDSEPLLREWVADHPENFRGRMIFVDVLMENERWDEAMHMLRRLIDLAPAYIAGDNAYVKLAALQRQSGDTAGEMQTLKSLTTYDAAATEAFLRLIELATEREDWESLERNALRLMAVNPLTAQPHAALAMAAEHAGDHASAVTAYRSLLDLSPNDPASVHFGQARHLSALGDDTLAKRHVLQALEDAPRYRDAQHLLLELTSIKDSVARDNESDLRPPAPSLPE